MFNPTRLTLARKRRGMTKIGLADATGLSTRSVSAYEAGTQKPTSETVEALSRALRFPIEFFDGADLDEPTAESASFRAYASMTARQRDAALAAGTIALELSIWIDRRFDLPKPNIPNLRGFVPEVAAQALREHWGIGERPIRNSIHLLEAQGVRVFSLVQECVELNAFSLWKAGLPFVFLNTMKSAESSRFDVAHELGHLALHQHGGPRGRAAELEADRFASAFLMPPGSVLAAAPRFSTVDNLLKLKKQWNVSAIALAHRLHFLRVISDWNYRTICIGLSERGGRTTEIEGGHRENSQLLTKVFEGLRKEHVSKTEIARELAIPNDDLNSLVFGLVIGPVPSREKIVAARP